MHGPKEIIEEAGSLPVEERAFIIDSLLQTLNPTDEAIDGAWLATARRRLEELKSGSIKAVAADEAFGKIQKRFGQ
ncbi:MAG: addiction module protein [Elusimicrobia bacterium CG1_02_63_36]|nr:MAG: addiction module protein [Elusimicrobia bacterium CG1_02_63_36]PIP84573.1 MAG: addiction module protein [Elusimicrobia bacterium CG22_combo_CG10-13_8_21_14_all_63_91]PJA11441.1 MAG: addiction module protein [Elusimicrobia bacterium CG_4_10_14_0_2_um_filter_63_34]PJB25879.1 MAG: addiction module protein [Elusimicrobia bacterium CG_4_9_14_3_um_filter_62_55]